MVYEGFKDSWRKAQVRRTPPVLNNNQSPFLKVPHSSSSEAQFRMDCQSSVFTTGRTPTTLTCNLPPSPLIRDLNFAIFASSDYSSAGQMEQMALQSSPIRQRIQSSVFLQRERQTSPIVATTIQQRTETTTAELNSQVTRRHKSKSSSTRQQSAISNKSSNAHALFLNVEAHSMNGHSKSGLHATNADFCRQLTSTQTSRPDNAGCTSSLASSFNSTSNPTPINSPSNLIVTDPKSSSVSVSPQPLLVSPNSKLSPTFSNSKAVEVKSDLKIFGADSNAVNLDPTSSLPSGSPKQKSIPVMPTLGGMTGLSLNALEKATSQHQKASHPHQPNIHAAVASSSELPRRRGSFDGEKYRVPTIALAPIAKNRKSDVEQQLSFHNRPSALHEGKQSSRAKLEREYLLSPFTSEQASTQKQPLLLVKVRNDERSATETSDGFELHADAKMSSLERIAPNIKLELQRKLRPIPSITRPRSCLKKDALWHRRKADEVSTSNAPSSKHATTLTPEQLKNYKSLKSCNDDNAVLPHCRKKSVEFNLLSITLLFDMERPPSALLEHVSQLLFMK